jgi:Tetratricopeptide repeat
MAALVAFVLVLSFCNIRSLDLWWHLKTGEWIWQQHRIPHADPFSHSAGDQPWISHEWLFGLLSYLAYAAGGVTGLVSAKALLIAALFVHVALTARTRGASSGMTFLVLAACYAISRFRFTERPELFSTPFAASFILAHEISRRRGWLIMVLPAVQLLWVNLHGGTALLGWALAGTILLDRAWELRREGVPGSKIFNHPGLRRHLISTAGVFALSFANPHGAKALFYGLLRTESPLDNKEFQSLAEIARSGVDLSVILFVLFAALLIAFAFTLPRTFKLYEWVLLPVLLLLTVVFFRFRPLFIFLLAPSLAFHLSRGQWLTRLQWWIPALGGVLLLARVTVLEREAYFYRFGAAVHTGVFPVEAANFVKQTGLSGKMFNTYGIGGYLIWELWPDWKVFIDGREDVYLRAGVLEDYLTGFADRERWQALVKKYGIDFAMVRYPESAAPTPDRSLETVAFERQNWALVYFDDTVVIYARRNGRNDSVVQRYEIRSVQPLQLSSYLDPIAKDPEQLRLFLDEMNANLRDHPSSFRSHFTLGMLAVKRGPEFLSEALREFHKVVELNPDFAPAYVNLGSIYLSLGRRREAEAALKKALALEENPVALEQLKLLRKLR